MTRSNSRSVQFGLRIPLQILRRIDDLVADATRRGLPNVSRAEVICAILSQRLDVEPPRPEVVLEDNKS
jgi:hypothetical protein